MRNKIRNVLFCLFICFAMIFMYKAGSDLTGLYSIDYTIMSKLLGTTILGIIFCILGVVLSDTVTYFIFKHKMKTKFKLLHELLKDVNTVGNNYWNEVCIEEVRKLLVNLKNEIKDIELYRCELIEPVRYRLDSEIIRYKNKISFYDSLHIRMTNYLSVNNVMEELINTPS